MKTILDYLKSFIYKLVPSRSLKVICVKNIAHNNCPHHMVCPNDSGMNCSPGNVSKK